MSLTFTAIPQSTFDNLQLNAGVLLSTFDPTSPTLTDANIICATTGGIKASAVPEFMDLGDGIDNAPLNVKELKQIKSWTASLEFTSLGVNADVLKLALGAATKTTASDVDTIKPNQELDADDFQSAVWWVGDLANGGFVAVKLKNALSTAGLSIQSSDKGKGQLAVTLTGHYTLTDQTTVPIEFYIGE